MQIHKYRYLFNVIAILALMLATSCQSPFQNDSKEVAVTTDEPGIDSQSYVDAHLGWRNLWFTINPDELGLDLDPNTAIPFAVVMDIGQEDGVVVSLASSIIGDGSIVSSTGNRIFGGVEYENVRNASKRFVEISADFVDEMELTTEYPLPSADNIKFYVITPNGIYTAKEATWDDLGSGVHELSPLFYAGNDVLTALRKAFGL